MEEMNQSEDLSSTPVESDAQSRIRELQDMPYAEYLKTPEWRARREKAIEHAEGRCQVCNTNSELQAHHRVYDRRGNERPTDLTVLCKQCHEHHHAHMQQPDQVMHTFKSSYQILEEALESGTTRCLPTGYDDLDCLLNGGLYQSDLIILGGRTRNGKTAFAINIALNIAKTGKTVAFFSLEMSQMQIIQRMIATLGRINMVNVLNDCISDAEKDQYVYALGALCEMSLLISGDITTTDGMCSQITALSQEGHKPDIIVIDYIGLIAPDKHTRNLNTEQQVRVISRSLKLMARQFDVPVLALSQLSRASETRSDRRPQLTDLRDSGALENDADVVFLIHCDDVYEESPMRPNVADIIVAKHRNGAMGEISIYYSKKQNSFRDFQVTPIGSSDAEA